jgi:AcrR family transcriptional regulator
MPRRYRSRKRAEAVEQTRRRILEATMELHGKQGILATSWEDIARQAGVSLATVYRHFPSLDELVPACGALSEEYVRSPTPELAQTLFTGAATVSERVERLVRELAEYYERAAIDFVVCRREAHALEPLREWLEEQKRTREILVREALRPASPDEQTVALVNAITAFGLWESLIEAGVEKDAAPGIIQKLVLCCLPPAAL